jgi:hypothetical protein
MTIVYQELFSGASAVNAGLAVFSPAVAPVTGPTALGSCAGLSLSGTGFVYNNDATNTVCTFQVTVPPMAFGSISITGVSQRDAGGAIASSTGTVCNGGFVAEMQVTASNTGQFFHGGYVNVKSKDNPTYTSRPIGRNIWAEVDFPAYSEVLYPVTGDPFDLRFEFSATQYEVFINGVSVGVRSQSLGGSLFDTFAIVLAAKCGISSVQIDEGLVTPPAAAFWTGFLDAYETV